MTITISWWLVPFLITAIAFVWAFIQGSDDFTVLLVFPAAATVSLAAWLVWALFN